MGSLANLFNLNLTTDLPSIQKTNGGYLGKLEIPAHAGNRTVTQTYNNVLSSGTPYVLMNINNSGWQLVQYQERTGTYQVSGSTYWWAIEWVVNTSGKNIVASIRTRSSYSSGSSAYNFPATSMEVAFIEMSEPV